MAAGIHVILPGHGLGHHGERMQTAQDEQENAKELATAVECLALKADRADGHAAVHLRHISEAEREKAKQLANTAATHSLAASERLRDVNSVSERLSRRANEILLGQHLVAQIEGLQSSAVPISTRKQHLNGRIERADKSAVVADQHAQRQMEAKEKAGHQARPPLQWCVQKC